jgi:hypothetical protein
MTKYLPLNITVCDLNLTVRDGLVSDVCSGGWRQLSERFDLGVVARDVRFSLWDIFEAQHSEKELVGIMERYKTKIPFLSPSTSEDAAGGLH